MGAEIGGSGETPMAFSQWRSRQCKVRGSSSIKSKRILGENLQKKCVDVGDL